MFSELLKNNELWRQEIDKNNPDFFSKLSEGQSPDTLLIGCSDSRFPIEVMTKSQPGEIFVHRNVANVINPNDPNVMSAIEYSVKALNISHIVVCGHYGCGGVKASYKPANLPWVDEHIKPIKDLVTKQDQVSLTGMSDDEKHDFLVEQNVLKQCDNLHEIDFIKEALENGSLKIHGWVFELNSGKIVDISSRITELTSERVAPGIVR